MTQFSLFGAEAATPALDDLDGLLLAGGDWVRSPAGARLSVRVADRWRADALAEVFATHDLADDDAVIDTPNGFSVRSTFADDLRPHAARWTRGANRGLPTGFRLGPVGLRLWTIAAGRPVESGYLLATAAADDPIHQAAGAQLSRLGVAAASLAQRGGPGWRVSSTRRLRRFVELIGPAPDGGADDWPDATPTVPS